MPRNRITAKARRYIPQRSIEAKANEGQDPISLFFGLLCAPSRVVQDAAAWQALQNLARAGISDGYLVQVLHTISDKAAGHEKGRRTKNWALPSGLSRRQLNALPKRIDELAAQIEKINAHRLLAPDALHKFYLTKGLRRAAQIVSREPRIALPYESSVSMSSLPNAMKAYATQLRRRIEQVSELRRGPAKGTESDFGLKEQVLKLIATVNDVTGKYPWTDLANVLYPIVAKDRAWLQDADALRSFYLSIARIRTCSCASTYRLPASVLSV